MLRRGVVTRLLADIDEIGSRSPRCQVAVRRQPVVVDDVGIAEGRLCREREESFVSRSAADERHSANRRRRSSSLAAEPGAVGATGGGEHGLRVRLDVDGNDEVDGRDDIPPFLRC